MATSKTLTPTNVTIQIPEFTDQPDQRVNSNCIDKEADAINALNGKIEKCMYTQYEGGCQSGSPATFTADNGAVYLVICSHPYGTGCAYVVYGWPAGAGRITVLLASPNTTITIDSNRLVTITTSDSALSYKAIRIG